MGEKNMRNNLLGMALWQKDAQNNGLKPIIDEFVALKKEEIENCPPEKKNKLALEAELFFSGAVSLKDEFLKIKKEIEKEEIKAELESMTEKIKELEMANEFEESGGAKKRVQKGGRNKNQDKQSPQKRQGERFCHLRRDYQRISAHRRRCGAFGRYLRHF